MKKKILGMAVILFAFSCGNDDSVTNEEPTLLPVEERRSQQITTLYDYPIKVNQAAHVAGFNKFVNPNLDF